MCGIAGFVADAGSGGASRAEAVARGRTQVGAMLNALRHRGPDADGIWTAGVCTLGHRRLSIIDLSDEARQPLLNEDGTVGVVVNGEIYNFAALQQKLRERGHTLRSGSDSEVVVHLWEEYGPECVSMLDGMFALALWDARKNTLLLARDRMGKKPLFYRKARSGLLFASELHALVTAVDEPRPEVDLGAIDEFLTLQYVPAPLTAWKGVFAVCAAHHAVVTPGADPAPRRYWQRPRGERDERDFDTLAQELSSKLDRAVARRLVSDVPLGAFLSGGLDSSAVVASMASMQPLESARSEARIKTFSIAFGGGGDGELRWARAVARRYGTDHHEFTVAPSMIETVNELVRHHGQPFADSSAVATWHLAKMTREKVTVALSGDGADEILAGYKRYDPVRVGQLYDALGAVAAKGLRAGLTAVIERVAPHLAGWARALGDGDAERYLALVGYFSERDKSKIYGSMLQRTKTEGALRRFEAVMAERREGHALEKALAVDFETYLTDDINAKVDIAAMAHGLEVRCPFLDTELVEFAAKIAPERLMRVRGKALLRRAMRERLPLGVRHRVKRGFALPLERWFLEGLGGALRETLTKGHAVEHGLIEPGAVGELVDGVTRRPTDADKVWTLWVLETWLREVVDR